MQLRSTLLYGKLFMKKSFSLLLLYFLMPRLSLAQSRPVATWTSLELVLNNGIVQRTIKLPAQEGNFLTTDYKPVKGDFAYFQKTNPDFQFELNDKIYAGSDTWKLVQVQKITDTRQGDGAAVTLQSKDGNVELTVNFLLYPNLPVIRKSLTIKNLTNEPVRLESVDVEKLIVTPYYATTFSWICHDYGRRRSIGPYDGNFQDALADGSQQRLAAGHCGWQRGRRRG